MYDQQQEEAMYQKLLIASLSVAITAIGMNINHPSSAEVDAKIVLANKPIADTLSRMSARMEHVEHNSDESLELMQRAVKAVEKRSRLTVAMTQRNGVTTRQIMP